MTLALPRAMRALAICRGPDAAPHVRPGAAAGLGVAVVHGVAVPCGFAAAAAPAFGADAARDAARVLVRVRAFSCNYRDKQRVLRMATAGPRGRFLVIGSEFVADVVAVGREVSAFRLGDRVMGDNHYPDDRPPTRRVGVPTDRASSEYLIVREDQLRAVPPTMSDADAAAFSIGAQTAYSMVRKLALTAGAPVLVTAGGSNTSIFVVAALRAAGARVFVTTTSVRHHERLRALGAEAVFQVPAGDTSFAGVDALRETAAGLGGFAGAVDPFFDLHLCRLMPTLAPGGRYVTCGFFDQHTAVFGTPAALPDYTAVLQAAILKNVTLVGSCSGVHDDLVRALADWGDGKLPVTVDTLMTAPRDGAAKAYGATAAAFVRRTFADPDRFGKVVFTYG